MFILYFQSDVMKTQTRSHQTSGDISIARWYWSIPGFQVCATTSVRGSREKGAREEQPENDQSVECQPFGAGARRSLAALFTKSARELAFIFRITLPRCAFTVISLMPSSPATCLFN